MVAWAIWTNRNERRHGGVMKFATRIGIEALEYLAEYQECIALPKQRREVQLEALQFLLNGKDYTFCVTNVALHQALLRKASPSASTVAFPGVGIRLVCAEYWLGAPLPLVLDIF
nr:hypothetical protein CFP56_59513 [Quercus suber]